MKRSHSREFAGNKARKNRQSEERIPEKIESKK